MYKAIHGIDDIMDGAVSEQFQSALNEVLANLYDINRVQKEKRKLIVEFSFTPNAERTEASMDFRVKTKLADLMGTDSRVYLEVGANGDVVAYEHTRVLPGQVDMHGEITEPAAAHLGTIDGGIR